MTLHLNIGPEGDELLSDTPKKSKHVLNIKNVDADKKQDARRKVSVDLKEEIKVKNKQAGRLCIVGELPRHKQGLGRAPMVIAAVLVIGLLNLGQLVFLGTTRGEEALALATEATLMLQGAGQSFVSGEEGSEILLFGEAESLFNEAKEKAGFLLKHDSPWLAEPSKVQSLRNLLEAGTLMAEVGIHLGEARQAFTELPEEGSLTDHLREVSENHLEPAAEKAQSINMLLAEVDLSGTPYEDSFDGYQDKLDALLEVFDLWLEAKEPVLTALGDRYVQHYLVLLMNDAEMRLGGGFIGSYAIVEINDGRLTDLEFKDIYELDNAYNGEIDIPVHELRPLADNWRLRDSNTSPDFPTSAQNAMMLADLEGEQGVDGVIAINLSAVLSAMEVLGPITVDGLNQAVDADSFSPVMSTLVESKTFGQTTPKEILGRFIDAFVGTARESNQKPQLALSVLQEFRHKNLAIYHSDESVQKLLTLMDMDGSMPALNQVEDDFLYLATTNVGGDKTDQYMATDLQHDTHLFDDGTLVNSLTITRTHRYNEATSGWLKGLLADYGFTDWTYDLERIMGNKTNRSGLRIYLPENVQILDVKGDAHRDDLQYYYDPEQDVTYYYFEQSVAPASSESLTIIYALPWYLNDEFQEYTFQLFKQPGLNNVHYEKTISAPNDIMLSSYPLATRSEDGLDYILNGQLQQDLSLTLLYR